MEPDNFGHCAAKGSFQSLPDLQMAREQQGGQGRECPDKAAHKGLLFPRWEQRQPRLGLVGGQVGSEGMRGGARTGDPTCTQHRFHVPDRLYPLYTLARGASYSFRRWFWWLLQQCQCQDDAASASPCAHTSHNAVRAQKLTVFTASQMTQITMR